MPAFGCGNHGHACGGSLCQPTLPPGINPAKGKLDEHDDNERSNCRSWAAIEIGDRFVTEARQQGGLDVSTLRDLKQVWASDGSQQMILRMFQVLYGQFDATPNWARQLEAEYMQFSNIKYKKEPGMIG